MNDDTIYLKAEKSVAVTNTRVLLEDIVKLYGTDKKIIKELNRITAINISDSIQCKYSVSILKVMELIHHHNPTLKLENVGETDFVLEYVPPSPKKKIRELAKVIFVCATVFSGSFFTIMTFNEDVSVKEVFELLYMLIAGSKETANGTLEIGYSIGLVAGICVFYNHIFRKKMDNDPTPLQIQLRLYEDDMDKAIIKNAEREKSTIDARQPSG